MQIIFSFLPDEGSSPVLHYTLTEFRGPLKNFLRAPVFPCPPRIVHITQKGPRYLLKVENFGKVSGTFLGDMER